MLLLSLSLFILLFLLWKLFILVSLLWSLLSAIPSSYSTSFCMLEMASSCSYLGAVVVVVVVVVVGGGGEIADLVPGTMSIAPYTWPL